MLLYIFRTADPGWNLNPSISWSNLDEEQNASYTAVYSVDTSYPFSIVTGLDVTSTKNRLRR
jgi:hypothetical protein